LTQCPECGGALRKQYGSVGVTFNGSGFYRTDSRSSTSGGALARRIDFDIIEVRGEVLARFVGIVTGARRRIGGTVIKGFKDFIMRGNVIDLAVAVVIGAAFTAVVNAIVASIITRSSRCSGSRATTVFPASRFPRSGAERSPSRSATWSALISFLAVAIVVYFVFVFPMNAWKERQAAKAGVPEDKEEKLPTEQELLIQIRDLLEKNATAR
jgi:large conductance mechanosensitive channel